MKIFLTGKSEQNITNDKEGDDVTTLYISLPYLGEEAEQIIKKTKSKLYRTFKESQKVKINVQLKTTKLSFFAKKRYHSSASHTWFMNLRAPVVLINISKRLIRPYLDGQKNTHGPKKIVRSVSTLLDAKHTKTLLVCLK